MRKIEMVAIIVCFILGCLCASAFSAPHGSQVLRSMDVSVADQEQEFLTLLNDFRASRGLQPVVLDETLSDGARRWSVRLRAGYWGHGAGYENIYRGSYRATDAFRAWKNSPGHCRNMLNPGFTRIGIGVAGNAWTFRGGFGAVTRERIVIKTKTVEKGPAVLITADPCVPCRPMPMPKACAPVKEMPEPCVKVEVMPEPETPCVQAYDCSNGQCRPVSGFRLFKR